jgi:hypothetical protein
VRGYVSVVGVVMLVMLAPPAASGKTLNDPVNDNCRTYPFATGNFCGPDITRADFSLPGDGFLHIDVDYASMPSSGGIAQTQENIELGIYPKTATAPDFNVLAFRFSKWGPTWKLQQKTSSLAPVADGSATITGPLGIELRVPVGPLGNPTDYLYALNAGRDGEVIPEHPDLAPNSGLFDLGSAGAKRKCKKKKAKKPAAAAKAKCKKKKKKKKK